MYGSVKSSGLGVNRQTPLVFKTIARSDNIYLSNLIEMKNQVNWLNCQVNILVPSLCNRNMAQCVCVICVPCILSLLLIMHSLEFFFPIILPAVLCPWGPFSST
jgi:hypothetical protein